MERFIADIANLWKSVICIGVGNEGGSAGHTAGVLREDMEERIPLATGCDLPHTTAFQKIDWFMEAARTFPYKINYVK